MRYLKYLVVIIIWLIAFLVFNINFVSTLILAVILFFIFEIIPRGDLSFWKKAGRNPDFFYEQLIKDDAWLIDDGLTPIDKKKCHGPFRLYVPKIGKVVKFYSKNDKYLDSQKRIEEQLKNISISKTFSNDVNQL